MDAFDRFLSDAFANFFMGGKMKKEYLCIGKIVGSRGINGEVKVDSFCDYPEDFYNIKDIYLNINEKPLDITGLRIHKSQILMKINGVENKNSAEVLRGKLVYAYKKDIPIEEGRYFIEDLKGCIVIDYDKKKILGKLKDVLNTGANDIYIVEDELKKEYLVPIIDGTVKEIDIEKQEILINPIRGIFDE